MTKGHGPVKVGWGVSVVLKEPVADLGCYVGEVRYVDDRGIRITLMDWMIGECLGHDFWVPWSNVLAMQVKTDQDTGWEPARFQTAHEKMRTGKENP